MSIEHAASYAARRPAAWSTATSAARAGAAPSAAGASSGGGSAVDLLPSPRTPGAPDGDIGAEIAALVIRSAADDQRAHRMTRRQQEAAEDAAEGAQVVALRQKADDDLVAGIVGGATTAAAAFAGDDARLAGAIGGGGKAGEAWFKSRGEGRDAEATLRRNEAGRAARAGGDEKDAADECKKLVQAALDFYKEYTGARDQAANAALHRA